MKEEKEEDWGGETESKGKKVKQEKTEYKESR